MRKLVRRSTWLVPTLFVVVFAAGAAWVYRELTPYPSGYGASAPIYVTVQRGTPLRSIAEQLHQQGVLRDPFLFSLVGRFQGVSRSMKAGDYAFRPGTSPFELRASSSTA